MKKEIKTKDDVKFLVDRFYKKVRKDKLLGEIFNQNLQYCWLEHHEKMYFFWETVLFEQKTCRDNPFLFQSELTADKEHFDRWTEIFIQTVDRHYTGEKAIKAKCQILEMSKLFRSKKEFHKNYPGSPLL